MLSAEILEKLEECKDAKEIQALAKASGYELTDEQAEEAYAMLNEERELTEEELAKVAGGMCWSDAEENKCEDFNIICPPMT